MLGDYARAVESFKKSLSLAPGNAETVLWLGRTWGRKAEKASFITAGMNASEARRCFEKAIILDPFYREALNDLFSYYLEAPSFLGGGPDKAEAIAQRTKPLSPAEYEYDEAQLALKKKDDAAAEKHLRRALELDPAEPGRVLDVARFLARHGRHAESEALFERADKIAPGKPATLFVRAQTYLETGRNPDEAKKLLRQYLRSSITPDDPPRQAAEKMLRSAG
jgi:tetratricopeptide (TPR) repeat protein